MSNFLRRCFSASAVKKQPPAQNEMDDEDGISERVPCNERDK